MYTFNPMGSLISIFSCLGNEMQCKILPSVVDDCISF